MNICFTSPWFVRPKRILLLLGIAAAITFTTSIADAVTPLWTKLIPQRRVPADPEADYSLTEDNGPWLVLAASFTGPEGERQARELVLEFRSRYNLAAYYYGMTFKHDDDPGRGLDAYGSPIRRRYNRGDEVLQHAVLVGDFPRIDDPQAQAMLARVKGLRPHVLEVGEGDDSHQSLATFRQMLTAEVSAKLGKKVEKGPLAHAFITRNQMLPREYFVPRGVDPEVAKWNEDVEHSLLDCPGRYSIRVATFRGRTYLKDLDNPIHKRVKRPTEEDLLVQAALNAHKLTVALRSKGWEAYEFHDRHESYVTVGSFDEMHQLPDGRLLPSTRDAQIIVQTFGAASPQNVFNRPATEDVLREAEVKRQFQHQFTSAPVAEGFHPKRFVGLPLDIQPTPVQTPTRGSISSAYARR